MPDNNKIISGQQVNFIICLHVVNFLKNKYSFYILYIHRDRFILSRSTCWVSVSVPEDDANRIIIQSAEFTIHLSFNHPRRLLVIFSPQHLLTWTFKHWQDSGFTRTMECFVNRRDPPHCQFPVGKKRHFVRLGFVGKIFFFLYLFSQS